MNTIASNLKEQVAAILRSHAIAAEASPELISTMEELKSENGVIRRAEQGIRQLRSTLSDMESRLELLRSGVEILRVSEPRARAEFALGLIPVEPPHELASKTAELAELDREVATIREVIKKLAPRIIETLEFRVFRAKEAFKDRYKAEHCLREISGPYLLERERADTVRYEIEQLVARYYGVN